MSRILTMLAMLFITTASANSQEFFPALYRVVGVASDDVLNVRMGPGADTPIVATLSPRATGIEAAGADPDSGWILVNVGEQSGYASPRFLRRLPGQDMHQFPKPLSCGGTEPFWGLSTRPDDTASFYDPIKPDRSFAIEWEGPAASRLGDEFGIVMTAPTESIQAVIQRAICSDGMSDSLFGLKIDAIVQTEWETYMMTGCCSIRRR